MSYFSLQPERAGRDQEALGGATCVTHIVFMYVCISISTRISNSTISISIISISIISWAALLV